LNFKKVSTLYGAETFFGGCSIFLWKRTTNTPSRFAHHCPNLV